MECIETLMRWSPTKEASHMCPHTTSATSAKSVLIRTMTSRMKVGTLLTRSRSDLAHQLQTKIP